MSIMVGGSSRQKRILVDHSVASNAVSELLRLEGYLLEEKKDDDKKALSAIYGEKYAAIISDLLSGGLRVLETLKGTPSPVPIILMSNEHILTRNEAIQLGAYELIEQSDLAHEQLNNIKRVLDGAKRLEPAA